MNLLTTAILDQGVWSCGLGRWHIGGVSGGM